MTWMQALSHAASRFPTTVYDCNGQPHWIEIEHYIDNRCLPRLCTEATDGAFSLELEPYTKRKLSNGT